MAATPNDVAAVHPDYATRIDEWKRMRDAVRGQAAVHAAGTVYLPQPSGFQALGDIGGQMYAAYLTRAQFPEIVAPTLNGMLGVCCRGEPKIEMPDGMSYLTESMDGRGETIEAFHRAVVGELLQTGRVALLAEAPVGEGGEPYGARYRAEALINWSEDRTLYVLDETALRLQPDGFRWEATAQWRVLRLTEGAYGQQIYDENGRPGAVYEPTARGARPLTEIPMVLAGAQSLDVSPQNPPLMGVANKALAAYRLDADYRHQLYNSGQETLIFTGVEPSFKPGVVGAGVTISLQASDAKAQYVGPACVGIGAHKTAITDEMEAAAALGARMLDFSPAAGVEAADTVRMRQAVSAATLVTVVTTAAAALERLLRYVAQMRGDDPDAVTVTPNLGFLDMVMGSADALNLVKSWQSGAISYETLYDNLQRGGIASAERTAEEERDLIESEAPAPAAGSGGAQPPAQASDDETPPASDEDLAGTFDESLLGD